MKLAPIILSIILASSTVGYGLASAQMAGAGGGTPCSASYPCTKICGDHPCKPGEVYTAGGQNATNTNSAMSKSTNNATGTPSMTTQMGISANVTATKITNGTMTNKMENGTMTGMNRTMTNGMVNEMGHTATVPPPAPTPSPAKQVASGTAP
ncbi:MAG: hypothetical protein KGI08_09955, partial [Thaumarchaeota archaeon]|nr:hypothetical protein [Nitrososphaerota archaeon]